MALGFAILHSACAGVGGTRTPLADVHRNAIQSTRTVANVSQEEVGVSINSSQVGLALGGGLLGALIGAGVNNTRSKDAEAAVAPIRTAMVGYDARATVEAALTRELANQPLFKATVLEQRRETKLDRSSVEVMLDQLDEDAVLLADFDYRFSPGFEQVVVTAVASFFPTKKASSPELAKLAAAPPTEPGYPRPLLYRATFMSSAPVPAGAGTSAERWAADGGAAARKGIDAGIDEVVRLLIWDLGQPAPANNSYAVAGVQPTVYKQLGGREWYALRTENGRTWLRAKSGELAAVPYEAAAVVKATEPASGSNPSAQPKKKDSNFSGGKFSEMKPAWEKDGE